MVTTQKKFIELDRRFRNITEKELENPELLAAFGEQLYDLKTDDWAKLLESRRVVLLAEAGSGKTEEMREQASKLKAQGKYAFYADLASLAKESLQSLLSAEDEKTFNQWKEKYDTPACFFLDSVDELKLTQGKLKLALNRFSKDIAGQITRAHVIISCRPSDWKFDLDLKAVQETISAPPAAANFAGLTGEELFIAAFRRDEGTQQEHDKSADKPDEVRTVIMLPLTRRQIETYARSCGVQDAAAFMKELQRQEAWRFANRPLDCGNLVHLWNVKGKLGRLQEQHEANIAAKLKDDPERPDNDQLTPEDARAGAERLALALALTRTRTLLAPGHEAGEGVLDPAAILTDWTDAKRNALLRRGLFDPATYGRIRFHHRSAEEYLAARRLKRLREKGMPIKALKHFFFAEKYGAKVVIPSMRPIAAWLALWNKDILRELIQREPEVLLVHGDPGSLSPEARAEVLRGFAAAYGDGGWRGVEAPSIGEVQRLACPELAPVIRELWGKHPDSEEVVKLFLQLIWQGAIRDCVDIAEEVAFDTQRPDYQRSIAVSGLVACGESAALRKIAESVLTEQEKWPDEIIPELAQRLFPAALSVQELISLIERTTKPRSGTSEFLWYFERIAEDIDPFSSTAAELRKAVAELIWKERDIRQEGYWNITGKYSYLCSGLAILCGKQLAEELPNDDLLWACAVVNRFKTRPNEGERVSLQELKEHFKNNQYLREMAFWIEVDLMNDLFPEQQGRRRMLDYYDVMRNSLLGYCSDASLRLDQIWLFKALKDTATIQYHRHIALEGLLLFWHRNECLESEEAPCYHLIRWLMWKVNRWLERKHLQEAVADDASLSEKVKKSTTPKPKKDTKLEWQEQRVECVRKGRERQRVEKWRNELLTDTEAAFSQERVSSTMYYIYHWLNIHTKEHSPSKIWNKSALTQAFNEEVAFRAAAYCKEIWRKNNPVLWSNRQPDKRGDEHYPWKIWHYGLFGLMEESSSIGWAKRLNTEEAERAAAYATLEGCGFPSWFIDLASTYPDVVKSVFGDEFDREIALAADEFSLPLLNSLAYYADEPVKQILIPRLCAALLKWDSAFTEEKNANVSTSHLNQVIRVLNDTAEADERAVLAAECAARFSKEQNGPLSLSWLTGLFHFDTIQGIDTIERTLNFIDESERTEFSIHIFAGIFGRISSRISPKLSAIDDHSARINLLKRLLQCAYKYIRPEQDNKHEGVYDPAPRDDAEFSRSQLLESLLTTPGGEAYKVIFELADDPLFADSPDWLRFRAREQAAKDAEFAPYIPDTLVTLEKKFEAPPRSRDELFAVMMDRLDDIQHYIAHHKFTIRQTLRCIKQETEMQRYLAGKLHDKANGAYAAVEREPEDADRKKPDIRLSAVQGDQQAAIEVKLAENWSINDFRRALSNQLVGQYLRHESCKAGCLLLTCNGSKSYWEHPETKEHICFSTLIDLLQAEADEIEKKNQAISLAVFGLDLTDPPLKPAHK
uniref:hypothetical protein n=1 Tax=Candidatus Electronema sp. TaxID=2698783 RepID=UPI0040577885